MKVRERVIIKVVPYSVLKDRKRIYAICDLYKRYIRSIYDVWKKEGREVWIRKRKKVTPPTHQSNFFPYRPYLPVYPLLY